MFIIFMYIVPVHTQFRCYNTAVTACTAHSVSLLLLLLYTTIVADVDKEYRALVLHFHLL